MLGLGLGMGVCVPTIAAEPSAAATPRVITLAPSLARLVCAAGACHDLVAVAQFTDAPPQAAKLPRIGGFSGINDEAILAAHPSLVLALDQFTPLAWVTRLQRLGLTVRVLHVHSLDDVATALRQIGDWLGTRAAAEGAAADYLKQLDALRQRYAHTRPVRVFFQLGVAPAYTVNRESAVSAAIAVCGGVNVFGKLPRIAEPVSAEAVLARQPQAVFYSADSNRAEIMAYWKRLSDVPAVTHHAIFPVAVEKLTGTPQVLDGIRTICRDLDALRGRRNHG
ncbi:MAG TPA: helical backbone metal receptor [Rhodanobacteraceae bacterium]|nr:helical backbone metal receptor [Rhodanobacteraceae bacterium]